jgi:hypothetical protein
VKRPEQAYLLDLAPLMGYFIQAEQLVKHNTARDMANAKMPLSVVGTKQVSSASSHVATKLKSGEAGKTCFAPT